MKQAAPERTLSNGCPKRRAPEGALLMFRIEPVGGENLPTFIGYADLYGREHDDSYLPGPGFLPGEDDPSYLLSDERGEAAGAVSLMLAHRFRAARRARLRIFHAREARPEGYRLLLEALAPHLSAVDSLYLFLPEGRAAVRGIIEGLGFTVERYAWHLRRSVDGLPEPSFPAGFALRRFSPGHDARLWCDLLNTSLGQLRGRLPLAPVDLGPILADPGYLPDGMLILEDEGEPVGTVMVSRDSDRPETTAEISALGLCEGYRGRGLGRGLLRAAVDFARRTGFDEVGLSVNAENSRAAELYLKEGFEKEHVAVCYGKRFE